MKEPEFYIKKAQSIIDELNKFEIFSLNESQTRSLDIYTDRKMVSVNLTGMDELNEDETIILKNKLDSDSYFYKELMFDIKILLKEFNDGDLFYNRFINENDDRKLTQEEMLTRTRNRYNLINKDELKRNIFLLNRFINYIKEYRR